MACFFANLDVRRKILDTRARGGPTLSENDMAVCFCQNIDFHANSEKLLVLKGVKHVTIGAVTLSAGRSSKLCRMPWPRGQPRRPRMARKWPNAALSKTITICQICEIERSNVGGGRIGGLFVSSGRLAFPFIPIQFFASI